MNHVHPLPPPSTEVGVDLAAALRIRRSTREFDSSRAIPQEALALLMWAANGVNGPEDKRTAPSAFGGNQVKVYLALAAGLAQYDAAAHTLRAVHSTDVRAGLCPDQWTDTGFGSIILTGRTDQFPDFVTPDFATILLQATAGCIAENVHLMAAALGLGTCMVGHMNVEAVKQALELADNEIPLYVMPLGYPATAVR